MKNGKVNVKCDGPGVGAIEATGLLGLSVDLGAVVKLSSLICLPFASWEAWSSGVNAVEPPGLFVCELEQAVRNSVAVTNKMPASL